MKAYEGQGLNRIGSYWEVIFIRVVCSEGGEVTFTRLCVVREGR